MLSTIGSRDLIPFQPVIWGQRIAQEVSFGIDQELLRQDPQNTAYAFRV